LVILAAAIYSTAWAQAPGDSPSAAVPIGTTVTGIIECGEGYTSHELYDMKITLLEVFRGEEAWMRIKAAASSNKPAASGTEYVLARVKFEYRARVIPGLCVHKLVPEQFAAYSVSGEEYKTAPVASPKPEMRRDLKSGESFEGWLAFTVPKDDRSPLLSFAADAGGAVQHGEPKWFLLRR